MPPKRKAPLKLAAPVARSAAKLPTKSTIDESRTCVTGTDAVRSSQIETIEISSDDDSDEEISDAGETHEPSRANGGRELAKPAAALDRVNGSRQKADADGSDGEVTSPSFGELLRNNEPIDVPALLQEAGETSHAPVQPPQTAIVPHPHQSLTTVLTQALRTDDTDLLESCLHANDARTVENTIEQLDSSLVGILLSKLAARLHRRPGRAGELMAWVQWALVVHGGALASQPQVVQSLDNLQKVLAERAKGLNSLLALKGKLDLLEGQMALRRKMKTDSSLLQHPEGGEDDVVWVEGESDTVGANNLRRKQDDGGNGEDLPATNGFVGDSEDDEQDDMADEISAEDDDNQADYDDVDGSMGEEEESDIETSVPPSKAQKVSRSSLPRRK